MSTATKTHAPTILNGIDVGAFTGALAALAEDPKLAPIEFRATTTWTGGLATTTETRSYTMAGQELPHHHVIETDEPVEILGGNKAPNPQDLLLAALNACMTVGMVAGCTARGITIESLSIYSEIDFDLRGSFGVDPAIKPGAERIRYLIRIKGNAAREVFEEVHRDMMATSPNRWHLTQPIVLEPTLVVE
jgi:uncharacterized OsmC-like protein